MSLVWRVPLSMPRDNQNLDFKGFFAEDGDFRKIANKGLDWMNKYIRPHQLVTVSMFQMDCDDENSKDVLFSIGHTAGEEPEPLEEIASMENQTDGLYTLEFLTANEDGIWKTHNGKVVEYMNGKGDDVGFKVFSANFKFNSEEAKVVGVISWNRFIELSLQEVRSPGCCCNIF